MRLRAKRIVVKRWFWGRGRSRKGVDCQLGEEIVRHKSIGEGNTQNRTADNARPDNFRGDFGKRRKGQRARGGGGNDFRQERNIAAMGGGNVQLKEKNLPELLKED